MAKDSKEPRGEIQGRAKGGFARAESLTAEERSSIAKKAAKARWATELEIPQAICGSPDHPLRLGDLEVPCYVLDDDRRVLVQRGMVSALGMSRGSAGKQGGDRLAHFANTKGLKPFISNDLMAVIINPIKFKVGGTTAHGYEATVLADLCDAVLRARKEEELHPQQEHIAVQCEILLRSFAKTGIVALVDEATGYQDIRARDALAQILEKFISEELHKWVKTFPPEFYKEMFRLWGLKYRAGSVKRPALVGKLTNHLVYERLAPGVLEELRRRTPRDDKGRLKTHLHRRLTRDVGHPKLREHLAAVTALMKASADKDSFMTAIDRALPKQGANLVLPFEA